MAKKLIKIFLFSVAAVSIIFLFVVGSTAYAADSNCNGVDDDGDGQCDEDFVVTTPCDSNADTDSCSDGILQCPKTCGVSGVYCDYDSLTNATENCTDCGQSDEDCDGGANANDPECQLCRDCGEYGGGCIYPYSDIYLPQCNGNYLTTYSSLGYTCCSCGGDDVRHVCRKSTQTFCPNGCANRECISGGGGGNTPPSSRLTASYLGGSEIASGDTKIITINQGKTITFAGTAWDCDGINDVENGYPQNNLGTAPTHPNSPNDPLGSCGKDIDYFLFGENETFSITGTFDRYIKIKDKSSLESTSTIQVTVQEEECVCVPEPKGCAKDIGENCGDKTCDADNNEYCYVISCNPVNCIPGQEGKGQCVQDDEICGTEPPAPIIPKFWREILPKF